MMSMRIMFTRVPRLSCITKVYEEYTGPAIQKAKDLLFTSVCILGSVYYISYAIEGATSGLL